MAKIIIKKINPDQLPEVIKMTRQAFDAPFKKGGIISNFVELADLAERIKKGEISILAAIDNKKIVGAVRYKPTKNGKHIYLFRLAVLKKYRHQGLGPKLVKSVEIIAKKLDYQKVKLDCMLEKELVPYYKKLGYRVYNVKKHHDHHDVFMYKRVNPFK